MSRMSTSAIAKAPPVAEKSVLRFGHGLPQPRTGPAGLLIHLSSKDLERLLDLESFVVIEPGLTPLARHQLLSEQEYLDAQEKFGEAAFSAQSGVKGLQQVLTALALDEALSDLLDELQKSAGAAERRALIRRLKKNRRPVGLGHRV